jgi:guanylate cyclase
MTSISFPSQDVAHGLLFLHGRSPPIVHADLKSANVLISSAFRAKVADFGLSVKQVTCGTPVSMAPELLRGGTPTTQSDVYAFGIVLYEIFARKGPYQAEIDGGMVRQVLRDVADLSKPSKLNISKIAPDQMVLLMQRCLSKISMTRPSFVDISKCLGEMGEVLFQIEYPHSVKRIVPGKATLKCSIPSHISTAILSGKMKYAGLFVGHLKPTCDRSDIFKLLGPGTTKMLVEAVQEVMQRALEEYNVQLVDTKTDSWLVISNMMEPQDDAAARIAYFALYVCSAVNQVAQNFGVDDKGFGMAGAISYGPVVAKILMSQSSRYCLFGEAVSEVFRLGQHTEYGHVLASHQVRYCHINQFPSQNLSD